MISQIRKLSSSRGSMLVELLASLTITGLVLTSLTSTYNGTVQHAYDNNLISRTNEYARLALDTISYDIRLMGAGMPMGQASFAPGGSGLGDAPLPILTSSTDTSLTLRANETGRDTILTANYTPSSTSLTFSVYSVNDLAVGDTIYLSNASVGGSRGLRGTIGAIGGTSITLSSGYVTSTGAVFEAGSLVNRVNDISYTSTSNWAGITRTDLGSTQILVPKSTVAFTYYDTTGAVITPPLTASGIQNALTSINVLVTVRSPSPLRSGETYETTSQQRITLRNLIMVR